MISDYKDLLVWQRGMEMVERVYSLTATYPASEQWGLTSQLRRAAVSIPSNIAEGYGRQATGEYRHHLLIARGSLLELETQVLLSRRLKFLEEDMSAELVTEINELNKMLTALISKLS